METNDLKPLEWSKLGLINRAQITSFEAFDPVNGREVQAWDQAGAGHGWELSDREENARGGRVPGGGGPPSLRDRWRSCCHCRFSANIDRWTLGW